MELSTLLIDLAHLFTQAVGQAIVFLSSALVAGSLLYGATVATIYMIRND
jgi:hypothetical protein